MSMLLAATGRKKRLIGVTSAGFPIHSIYGREETEEEKRKRQEQENAAAKSGESGSESGSSSGEGGEGSGSSEETKSSTPNRDDDVETYRRRAEAADRSKSEMEKQLNALRDKEKSDLERATSKLEEQSQTIEQVTRQRDEAIMRSEILKFPGYKWHDPEALLNLVDRNAIEIDKEGNVTGVKDAIKKLAESKPYLLMKEGEGQEQQTNKNKNGQQQAPPASGTNGSNGGQPDPKNEQREALAKKYKLRA